MRHGGDAAPSRAGGKFSSFGVGGSSTSNAVVDVDETGKALFRDRIEFAKFI